MSKKTFLRLLGAFMIWDGVDSFIFGKGFVRPWRRLGWPLRPYIDFLLSWPGWLIRVTGAIEAVWGARIFASTRVQVPEVYRFVSPVYDGGLGLWNATAARGAETGVDRAVAEYLPSGGSVLDLGCGTGVNLARLQRLGIPFSQYVGVDFTPEMLKIARRKFGHLPNVTFQQSDLLHDPLPGGEFDLIISTWAFAYLQERAGEAVQRAMHRLKPGGHVVLMMSSWPRSWLDPIAYVCSKVFLAEPMREEIYLALPGRIKLQQFMGGMSTLVVLRKET